MKKIIPAQSVIVCDVCGDSRPASFRTHAELHLKRDGLDWSSMPVGDASTHLDLCDECVTKVENLINNLKEETEQS